MKSHRGVTLLEVMIVMAVFSIVAVGVFEVIQYMTVANLHMSAQNDLVDWGDSAVNTIKDDLMQSRLVYENDATGASYMARCAFPAGRLPLTGSTMPTIDELGTFTADTVPVQKTGNMLLFIRTLPAHVVTIPGSVPPVRRAVDLYQFVAYYLTIAPGRPVGSRADSLALIQWESVRYADLGQINQIALAAERQAVVMDLVNGQGVDYAWDFSQPVTAAFWLLDGATGAVAGAPENPHTIAELTDRKLIAQLGLGFAGAAWNPTPTWSVPDAVPGYAVASAAGDGFPHGFEIQIVGPAGARQVLVRLVLVKFIPVGNRLASQETVVIANCREF